MIPCPLGSFSTGGLTLCETCPAGVSCPGGATNATTPCQEGYFCTRGETGLPGTICPAGTYRNTTGGASVTDCFPCPANYSCPQGGLGNIAPQPCADGYICPVATKNPTDFPCLPGTYIPRGAPQRSSRADCLPCPSGFFCGVATVDPQRCQAGTFCPEGSAASNATPCPLGHWSNELGASNASTCNPCPVGHFCPHGAAAPVPCPPGSFNPRNESYLASNCRACTASESCSTFGLEEPDGDCAPGHFCPEGTVNPTDTACPAGRYSDAVDAFKLAQCTLCPPGMACGFGSTSWMQEDCAGGHFCPEGTGSPRAHPCPSGTFTARTNASASSDCTICPAGQFCEGGRPEPSGPCAVGHFCPEGTNSSTLFPCAAGTFSDRTDGESSSDCIPCPLGSFCPRASAAPSPCGAGTFNNRTGAVREGSITSSLAISSWPACTSCLAGRYCGTANLTEPQGECPVGTYSAAGASVCLSCPPGYFCPSPGTVSFSSSGSNKPTPCPEGYFCQGGQSSGTDHDCPEGKYCPLGSVEGLKCPLGSFNPSRGSANLSSCQSCPAGSYCSEGMSGVSGPCAPGYYCPQNSSTPFAAPCPPSYRRQNTSAASWTECEDCPAGRYCPRGSVDGLDCPRGFFCSSKRSAPQPCPKGTYGNNTGLHSSSECWLCDAGSYCDQDGLTAPSGLCDPGFFCERGSTSSQPAEGSGFGGVCPRGGYCPQGSWASLPCPAGRFQNASGASDITLCQKCPPGFYCASTSSAGPTGPCASGYYCNGSADSPYQAVTPAGFFSSNGSAAPTACSVGRYSPGPAASACLDCEPGYFCPNQSTITMTPCPKGSFCPSRAPFASPCPKGTFNSLLGQKNSSDCIMCPSGSYCASFGLEAVSGPCSAGYFCAGGTVSPTPLSSDFGGIPCPIGYYCPQGTTAPLPCAPGSYGSSTGLGAGTDRGLTAQSECTTCPPGKYCAQENIIGDLSAAAQLKAWLAGTGMYTTPRPCSEGYYCTGGATGPTANSSSSTGGTCTPGHYCVAGSVEQTPCAAGSYQSLAAQKKCLPCPAGNFCVQGANTSSNACPRGWYCPEGTQYATQHPCPLGTYGHTAGGVSLEQGCTACPPGFYCDALALSNYTGPCAAGFFCATAASDRYGTKNVTGSSSTPCPAGFYCPQGAAQPLPCAAGTFLNTTGGTSATSCHACTSGKYCGQQGLVYPSGPCTQGYWCSAGSDTATPTGSNGNECPAGSACVTGSPLPVQCAAGSYQPQARQSVCLPCTPGFYCELGQVNPQPCPSGHWCGDSTPSAQAHPCPAGTFQPLQNRTSILACQPCPPGKYCWQGSSNFTGPCDGGYYCTGNNTTPTPLTQCGVGNFCPVGSVGPTICTANWYCDSPLLSTPRATCDPGWYCEAGARSARDHRCPAGAWCSGSTQPVLCINGTYNPLPEASVQDACVPCDAGWECEGSGLTAPSNPCRAGFYCPSGTGTPTLVCPRGSQCPRLPSTGLALPQNCAPGWYQNQTQQSACILCPPGYSCSGNTADPTPCALGGYCTGGNSQPEWCPARTYNDRLYASALTHCQACSPGHFCRSTGLTTAQGDGPCAPGYYCEGYAASDVPTADINVAYLDLTYTNDECLEGSYCVGGGNRSQSCEAGTFAPGRGNTWAGACTPCPRGQYCEGVGVASAGGTLCAAGFLCISKATVSQPQDYVTGFPCPIGTYCTIGALNSSRCEPGTANPLMGQGFCPPCLPGFFCSDYGQSAGYTCPLGSYCPSGTSQPLGCPAGSFGATTGLKNATSCTLCPAGKFCGSTNLTQPTGDCAAGFLCDVGSASARPSGVGPLPGSGSKSGPCPAGYFCPQGIGAEQPCAAGRYSPANSSATQASECLLCPPGQYCATQHLAEPTGACSAGYTCPLGSVAPNAVDCPAGSFCVAASSAPTGCPNGTYTNAPRQSSCQSCPERAYCINNGTVPLECPAQFYCPTGTAQPIACPDGTYGESSLGPLASANECVPCPLGRFCTGGAVRGNCSAGYLCQRGSASPQPLGFTSAGGPCPAGSWCGEGVTAPTPCPVDTLRNTSGAAQATDCIACPLGYQCLAGNPSPDPCPRGFWCPSYGAHMPCHAGTYQPLLAQTSLAACTVCPAGYACLTEGLADYQSFPCPTGAYCPMFQANASLCPGGTYNPLSRGEDITACRACDEGYSCPIGSSLQHPCVGGTYCPAASPFPRPCPSQFYCPGLLASPLPCPAGFFCPANATWPTVCGRGLYCPAMSAEALVCPVGFISLAAENRTSLNNSCAACAPGYFSSDASDTECTLCAGGYICTGAASTATPLTPAQGGYVCPQGYYCEPGARAPLPCPAGSFSPSTGGSSLASCLLCAQDTFQDLAGQSGCKPCTASSGSPPGSSGCACRGAHRAFQSSDQSCICEPGYEFVSDSRRLSEEDDVVDCQPIILSRCATGQARDSRGACVDALGLDCATTQCGGSPGRFSVPLGVCECAGQASLDSVCGLECRRDAPVLTLSNNVLTVTDPTLLGVAGANSSYSLGLSSIPGFIGSPDCRKEVCTFYSVVVQGGIGGVYGPPPALVDYAASSGASDGFVPLEASEYWSTMSAAGGASSRGARSDPSSRAAARTLQADSVYDGHASMNPSVICLVSGEGLLFDVSAAATGHYPVYLKDNLLNSNPSFDWGYFRNLSSAVASNASGVSMFAFSFHEPGVYVFADNASPNQISVVRVVGVDQVCQTPNNDPLARIQPFLIEALISNGVQRNSNIVITPDWALLGIMIGLIGVLVACIVLGLYFFQTHSWSAGKPTIPKYKEVALRDDLDVWSVFQSKGTVRSVDNVSKGLTSLHGTSAAGAGAGAGSALASTHAAGGVNPDATLGSMMSRSGAKGSGVGAEDGLASTGSDGGMNSLLTEWESAGLAEGSPGYSDDPNNAYMNELSSHLDLEGFDFHSLYKMLDETRSSVESHFEHQEDGLRTFYESMAMEIDHLKNILAVKMQVQLNKTGEGMSEAVDRLVSGELLARQAFQDLARRREMELTKTLEQLVTSIRNLNEDYHLFPIKELVRLCSEHILYCERGLAQERKRRNIFSSHTEIVGRPIIDALAKADHEEEGIQNSYMGSLKMFQDAVGDLLRKMLQEEQSHAAAMEKMDESSTEKRQQETLRYHLALCRLAKEIQQQLSYLDENLTPIFEQLRDQEDKTHHVWVHVQGQLLESRWATLLHPTEGRLFRGINPELAKVLTGLLGMRGGLEVDPSTGIFKPKTPFDPSEPFDTIFDYTAQDMANNAAARSGGEDSDLSDEDEDSTTRKKRKGRKGKHVEGAAGEDGDEDTEKPRRKRAGSDEAASDDENDTRGADGLGARRKGGRGGGDADDDETTGRVGGTTGSGAGAAAAADDDVVDPDAIPTTQEEIRARALADIDRKRRQLDDNTDMSAAERVEAMEALDAELAQLKQVFGDNAQHLLDEFASGQKGRDEELAEEAAAIAKLKADLLSKHAELAKLESAHTAEEAALARQLDREDAEADDSFAVDISKFDSLLTELQEEAGMSPEAKAKAKARRKAIKADGTYDEGVEEEGHAGDGGGAGSRHAHSSSSGGGGANARETSILNEYEFVISDMRDQGASDEKIKERITELHATKRAQLREKRMDALRKKQAAEAEAAQAAEAEMKQTLQSQLKDQAELATVMEALKDLDAKAAEAVAASGGAASSAVAGVDAADIDPATAAEFERNRAAIERRYKRAQLDREARAVVQEAFEYAKLEMRQEAMLARKLRAKLEGAGGSGDDGKQTEDELRDLLKGADADRATLESAQEYEKQLQKKKLAERLAAQNKKRGEAASKKKELELRAEKRKLEQANLAMVLSNEADKIQTALLSMPEPGRRKHAKRVIEAVMGPRHIAEETQLLGDHMEERMAFLGEQVHEAQEAGVAPNYLQIEHATRAKFDDAHAEALAKLMGVHRDEVKQAFLKLYADEKFTGEEWVIPLIDALAEYAKRKANLEARGKKVAESDTDETIARISEEAAAKQRAHEAKLKAEQEELERMQAEFELKESQRKAKRLQMEEESKKRELDLLDDLSDAQRADILNQHRLNLRNFERALDNERVKQAGLLEKSLEERRRKLALLKAKRKAALEKEKLQEKQMAKRLKKKLMRKMKDESVGAATDMWKMRAAAAMGGGGAGAFAAGVGALPDVDEDDAGNDSDDGVARHAKRLAKDEADRKELAEKQEVLTRLRTIEGMVEKIQGQASAWRSQIYVDAKDLADARFQPTGSEVVVCNVGELDARSLVLYRFGVHLLEVLFARGIVRAPVNGVDSRTASTPVHMLIASSLPPNPHVQTAFRNSFSFQPAHNILFLRRERLEDVGEFLLVLCHCLAHISTSASAMHAGAHSAIAAPGDAAVGVLEGWDDRNPAFVEAFHACLKFVCADIFYANAHKALQVAPHVLPLVQPISSQPLLLGAEGEAQVEGASSSSSSAAKAPSIEGLSAADSAAWFGSSVRTLAIDELLELHPLSSVDGVASSGDVQSGAASLHHSSGYSAARMLERMHEYQAFSHATELKANLSELEKNARAREHARELKEARSFRQRAVQGAPPPTHADDKSWQKAAPRAGQVQGLEQLQDIEDELTAELSSIAEQLYAHTQTLHQAERDARDIRARAAAPSAADTTTLAKLAATVQAEQSVLATLNRHKDHAIYRLRNVHAAAQQIEGQTQQQADTQQA